MPNAFELRQQLADKLKRDGALRDAAVERAVRAVPRHLFSPDTPLESAYEDRVLRLKDEGGVVLSTISQPAMIVEMLQQLRIAPGHRVLEIGTGSGYTTALLATLTGPTGCVVSIDLESDLVEAAQQRFEEFGLLHVHASAADGALGEAAYAPYDRVLLTVCAADIVAAWWEQLARGGRIVLPLSLRGVQKSIAFAELHGVLESESIVDCGFLMLRGPSLPDERVERDRIRAIARAEVPVRRLAAEISERDLYAGLMLWIALQDDHFCRIDKSEEQYPAVGLCIGDSLALLVLHPVRGIASFGSELGLGRRLSDLVAAWDAAGRPGKRGMHVTAVRSRAETKVPEGASFAVRRPETTFYVSLR
ncbi:MAG: methyltransferase domain-containing protein [Candidatus Eremiobacteraeota bacterium]|nr:methyltransferase domain-containing protein [Candidatus Eremiobacteraeota bacterium]